MNIIILLISLISPYFNTPVQQEPNSAAFNHPASAVLAFQHPTDKTPYISRFDTLAGVSLFATEQELLEEKGLPLEITKDPWQGCLEYQYEDMSAGICEGVVMYVHVTPTQAEQYGLELNGFEMDPTKNNLREILGTPDFNAEDGDVYMRESTALKIYRDAVSGEWLGIDLFDGNSS